MQHTAQSVSHYGLSQMSESFRSAHRLWFVGHFPHDCGLAGHLLDHEGGLYMSNCVCVSVCVCVCLCVIR